MDFNKQLRFGLRKSRVYGTLCSAILGAFIMAGPLVHADETQPLDTATEAVTVDTSKTATLATDVVTNPRSQGCPRFQSGEELANSVGKINAC